MSAMVLRPLRRLTLMSGRWMPWDIRERLFEGPSDSGQCSLLLVEGRHGTSARSPEWPLLLIIDVWSTYVRGCPEMALSRPMVG